MELMIDNCTWIKLETLHNLKIFDIMTLYEWAEIIITHAILKEIRYFKVTICQINQTIIKPVGNREIFDEAISLKLGEADASILSLGAKTEHSIIISEDGGVLEFARSHGFAILQLIDLFSLMEQQNIITKRELYKITRKLRELKNFTKKKQKKVKSHLHE